jgi:fatty-acyl-CoA synthase
MTILQRLATDAIYIKDAWRALRATGPIARNPTRIFPRVIDELADRYDDATALLDDHEIMTYRALAARANRYARWALDSNLAKGETVCLMMSNRPEFLAIWLGITSAGGTAALLNTNLVGPTLAHCIDVVAPKHLIVAADHFDTMATVLPLLTSRPQLWLHGGSPADAPRIDHAVNNLPGEPLTASERRALTIEDSALYIYTSGTTGLPKAANINHYRVMLITLAFAAVMQTRPSDRMYNCLPMYHTAGGLIAIGAPLLSGGTVVLRERFSASDFWPDIVRHDCTLFQYIGELCRYLVNSPPHPDETRHRLRLVCGNGLRSDIWTEFKQRFRIPKIIEFYAATEGNVTLFNFDGKPGAVGRIPWYLAHRFPTATIKYDVETDRPIRGADGLCIHCAPDEPGEAIGKIVSDPTMPGNRFEGYANKADDEHKILRNVFETDDAWFRTGDLLRQDAEGYYYFVDRVGDTFRWKGENVSTTEVADMVSRFHGIRDVTVYGVHVAGQEGRAGMAALVIEDGLDLAALHRHLADHLPDYAQPLFLRIRGEIDLTSTFKQKKIDLKKQGFDPTLSRDPIYFNDPAAQAFVPLDADLYHRIQTGQIRL